MVFQKIYFVDVQKTPMRARQKPRLEALLSARERTLQIERADNTIFRRTERQVDDRNGNRNGYEFAS